MAKCEVCGNDYYLAFEVVAAGATHVFKSFECEIQKMAPFCGACGFRIIDNGIETNDTFIAVPTARDRKGSRRRGTTCDRRPMRQLRPRVSSWRTQESIVVNLV